VAWLDDVRYRIAARSPRRLDPPESAARAAVLVPLCVAQGQLWLIVQRRSAGLPLHAGQLAFPGGMRNASDADEVVTALRETREELGIDPARVIVLGRLDDVRTSTGCVVTPVVGAVPHPLDLTLRREEVDEVITVPVAELLRQGPVEEQDVVIGNQPVYSPVYRFRDHRIWGATARILADLLGRLAA
jgi:8-oxo-dGTP pyrophosphatase MutT (NUDIX family)